MKNLTILLLILILGFFLRIYKLDSRPSGFTWDEAALGYNAYSLLETGRDEHGQILPLVFKSFGDYKPGLYIYLATPSIAIFGLNEFATRLPSTILGTLLILVVYLLTRELANSEKISQASAFLFAINPWAIHFSRAAWEANVSLFLTTFAILLFLSRRLSLSALFFGLTFWTYQGAKLFTPLLALTLLFVKRKSINRKSLIWPLAILFLFLMPIVLGLKTQSGRLKVFSIFSYTRPAQTISEILRQDKSDSKNLPFYLYHSEILDQVGGIILRYLNHFSPRFLFIEGDWSNPRQAPAPFYGNLHLPELLTLLIGILLLLRSNSPGSKILLTWLLLAPVPAALSRDIISAVRSLPMVVPLSIISGIGLAKIFRKKLLILIYSPVLVFFLIYFADLYFLHSPHYTADGWLYPYQRIFSLIQQHQDDYRQVVISPKLGQPYIFALFYLHYPPDKFQREVVFVPNPQGDVGEITSFDKFIFRPIYWPVDRNLSSTIFVGDQYELPEKDLITTPLLKRMGYIDYPNGSPALKLVALP